MSARLGVPTNIANASAPVAGSVKMFGKWDVSEVEVKDISLTGACEGGEGRRGLEKEKTVLTLFS